MKSSPDSVEHLLQSLTPNVPRIDRERLMFLAGHEAGSAVSASAGKRATRWLRGWQAATCVALCSLVALGVSVARSPAERIVYIERPTPLPTQSATASDKPHTGVESATESVMWEVDPAFTVYFAERERALRDGIDFLPSTPFIGRTSSPSREALMHEVCAEVFISQPIVRKTRSNWLDQWITPTGDRL